VRLQQAGSNARCGAWGQITVMLQQVDIDFQWLGLNSLALKRAWAHSADCLRDSRLRPEFVAEVEGPRVVVARLRRREFL